MALRVENGVCLDCGEGVLENGEHITGTREPCASGAPGFFKVPEGDPTDACPLCGIHRQHAGNPDACSPVNYRKPGCFAEAHDGR